ncbi:competence protein CoiA family protein [Streptomyces caniscabiei]|uniref:competence protein CoiA family protein n=1 Tax=Streptomyces caniscabiei TaxID=2746961 RepID=UPI000A382FF1|nr:competence protein CoiA family protein [Streptomyces caniscabiei]
MPFTALHPDAGRLDATQLDLGCAMDWTQIYKSRPRAPLTCPECSWGVHAKVSRYGVRFFCHDPGRPPSCELSNESWEHHMLKLELAGAIRAAGWYAELEVPAEDGSWRADVMASSPDGTQRMAWEAQLSPITVEDIRARTARYRAEKIDVCWVSPHKKSPQWMGAVPGVRVRAPQAEGVWVVDDGVAGFDYAAGGWTFREEELQTFVRWVSHGQLSPCRSLPRYRRVTRVVEDRNRVYLRDLWWTSRQSARAQTEHEEMRQRQEKAKQAREARMKQQEAEAERRRKELEEVDRIRRAEESALRRKEQKGHDRVLVEQMRERWAEKEARRAREQAEQEEKERQALETAKAWWGRLSRQQIEELFAAVAELAWREKQLRVDIPENPSMAAHFAYGVPVYSRGRHHALYGIVRPCPTLVSLSPQLSYHRAFVRNAHEVQEFGETLAGRITHLDLPGHEQLTMH